MLPQGKILNDAAFKTSTSHDYVARSAKVVTLVDLAGHERYFKTTAYGLTGHLPDFACLLVGANAVRTPPPLVCQLVLLFLVSFYWSSPKVTRSSCFRGACRWGRCKCVAAPESQAVNPCFAIGIPASAPANQSARIDASTLKRCDSSPLHITPATPTDRLQSATTTPQSQANAALISSRAKLPQVSLRGFFVFVKHKNTCPRAALDACCACRVW